MACDRTPYVYRIVSIYGEIYIGSRTAKKCDPREFWVTYFTSSKVVRSLIDKFGYDYFNIEHIEIFNTTEDAYRTEQKRIKDIWGSEKLLNRHFQDDDKDIWLTTSLPAERNPMFGRTGDKHPLYGKVGAMKGKTGKEHPMFGRRFPGMNAGEKNYWYGKSSPMKGCVPWENPSAIKYGTVKMWLSADTAFCFWKEHNVGYSKLSQATNISEGVCSSMIARFKAGWNPLEDLDWIIFKRKQG